MERGCCMRGSRCLQPEAQAESRPQARQHSPPAAILSLCARACWLCVVFRPNWLRVCLLPHLPGAARRLLVGFLGIKHLATRGGSVSIVPRRDLLLEHCAALGHAVSVLQAAVPCTRTPRP
eukprot:3048451-Rhodomonas_salina.1